MSKAKHAPFDWRGRSPGSIRVLSSAAA